MTELLFFVLGIIFIEFVIPIIEACSILIASWFEKIKAKMSVSIAECNVQIQDMQDDKPVHHAIGFRLPDIEEEEEDDE